MDKSIPVTTLFLDIGGVMLSNGWGHESRRSAADVFNPDFDEMDERPHVWQQAHNGDTYQDPGFIDHVVNKKSSIIDKHGGDLPEIHNWKWNQIRK